MAMIDELVLMIGLDPANFNAGRRQLEQEFDRVTSSLDRFGRNVEHTGERVGDIFSFMKRGAVGLLATFVGDEAAQFIDRIAQMDMRTGQLARSIGMNTGELSLWQGMVRAVGGTAAEASSALAGLNDAFMNMRMGNQMPNPAFASLLARSGVNWQQGTATEGLAGIMHFLQGQNPQSQRWWLQQVPGMNEGMMFLLMEIMRSPDKMAHLADELKRIGLASDQSAASALDLREKTVELEAATENLARQGFPILTSIVNQLTDMLQKFTGPQGARAGVQELLGPEVQPGGFLNRPFNFLWDYFTNKSPRSLGDMWGASNADNTFSARWGGFGGGGSASGTPAANDRENFIRKYAASIGLNPDIAMAVAKSEGFYAWDKSRNAQSFIPGEQSFGDFQLHYGGGLGDIFTKRTGLDARDPKNWQSADTFALQWAKKHGWQDWHGWKGDPRAGGAGSGGVTVHIGEINVQSDNANPKAVADEIPAAIKRNSMLAGINTGLN